jgi:hypothetical protein
VKRPVGVTILALLLLISGVVFAVHAAVLYTRPDFGADFTSAYLKHMFPIKRSEAGFVLWGAMVGSIISLAVGAGLWFLQDAARWVTLLVFGIPLGRGLIGAVITFFMDSHNFGKFYPDAFWFQSIAYGGVIYYLTRPGVATAFGAPDRYVQTFDPRKEDSRNSVDVSGS